MQKCLSMQKRVRSEVMVSMIYVVMFRLIYGYKYSQTACFGGELSRSDPAFVHHPTLCHLDGS